jgi:hypothetical protein
VRTASAELRVVRYSSSARSLRAEPVEAHLLPGHSDAQAFLGVDEVIVIILAKIELHPVDLAGEPAAVRGVVRADGCP